MANKQIVIGSVGIVIGFIMGFFVAQASFSDAETGFPNQPAAAGQAPIPEGHPSNEVMALLEKLEERAANHPEDVDVRVHLGNAYYDLKLFDHAIRWYHQALDLDPRNIDVNTDLGTAYYYSQNSAKAIELFERSLRIDGNHPQTLQNLGVVQVSLGNLSEAVESWEKLLETNPDYPHGAEIREQISKAQAQIKSGKS